MNEPKVAHRNKILLFRLPTCLGISYRTAFYTFQPPVPLQKSEAMRPSSEFLRYFLGVHFIASLRERQEPWLRH